MKPTVDVRFLPPSSASEAVLVAELVSLVNDAYATGETGLWSDLAARTTAAEVAALISAGQMAAAFANGNLVGSVRIQQLDNRTGEFGMLVTSPRVRGTGAGSALVAFAERWAVDQGLAVMQLEVLYPRTWAHPSKEFLRAWYTRLGYREVRTGHLDESYPHLAPLLATPCEFVIYYKPLGSARAPKQPDHNRQESVSAVERNPQLTLAKPPTVEE